MQRSPWTAVHPSVGVSRMPERRNKSIRGFLNLDQGFGISSNFAICHSILRMTFLASEGLRHVSVTLSYLLPSSPSPGPLCAPISTVNPDHSEARPTVPLPTLDLSREIFRNEILFNNKISWTGIPRPAFKFLMGSPKLTNLPLHQAKTAP